MGDACSKSLIICRQNSCDRSASGWWLFEIVRSFSQRECNIVVPLCSLRRGGINLVSWICTIDTFYLDVWVIRGDCINRFLIFGVRFRSENFKTIANNLAFRSLDSVCVVFCCVKSVLGSEMSAFFSGERCFFFMVRCGNFRSFFRRVGSRWDIWNINNNQPDRSDAKSQCKQMNRIKNVPSRTRKCPDVYKSVVLRIIFSWRYNAANMRYLKYK
jgi:hypothetical protein